MKMRRCEDEKIFYRPPLLEEPCAQTLSGITIHHIKQATNEGSPKGGVRLYITQKTATKGGVRLYVTQRYIT